MGPDQINWIPLGAGVTVIGILLSWIAWRRRGAASGIRGLAWSLVPLAAALTGAAALLWQLGAAVAKWAAGFVFDPLAWAGVAVAGLAAVLYVLSGLLRRRGGGKDTKETKAAKAAKAAEGGSAGSGTGTAEPPARRVQGGGSGKRQVEQGKTAADPDMAEIDAILKRRGIS